MNESVLEIRDGRWLYQEGRSAKLAPLSGVAEAVLKRVDRLTPESKEVLGYASLFGREFTLEKLLFLTGRPAEVILNALDEGIREHVLWPVRRMGEGVYSFSHDRIHEAFYQGIEPAVRRQRHEEIARRLEKETPDDLFAIAHHYNEGLDRFPALHFSRLAGDGARAAYANDEAVHFYRRALELLDKESPETVILKERLADIYSWVGKYQKAFDLYDEILPGLSSEAQVPVEWKVAIARLRSGDIQKSFEQFQKVLSSLGLPVPRSQAGLRLALLKTFALHLLYIFFPFLWRWRRLPNSPLMQEKLRLMMYSSYAIYFIDTMRALIYSLRGLHMAERVGPSPMLALHLSGYGILLSSFPLFRLARRAHRRGEEIWRRLNDPWGLAQIKGFQGLVAYYEGKRDESLRLLLESVEGMRRVGDPFEATLALYHLGMNFIWKGRFGEAEQHLLKGLGIAEEVQDVRTQAMIHSQLGWLYSLKGERDNADRALRRSVETAEQSESPSMRQMAYMEMGRHLCRSRRVKEAVEQLEKALRLVRDHNVRVDYIGPVFNGLAEAYLSLVKSDHLYLRKARRMTRRALMHGYFFRNHWAEACRLRAVWHSRRGHKRRAASWLERGLRAARKHQCRYEEAIGLKLRGDWNRDNADLEEAHRLMQEIGIVPGERKGESVSSSGEGGPILPRIELDTLLEASRLMSSVLNLNELLEKIMDKTIQVMRAERGFLMLYENGLLVPKVIRSVDTSSDGEEMLNASSSVIRRVEKSKQGLVVTDAQLDTDLKLQESVIRERLRSILAAPLLLRDRLLGVIYVDNRLVPGLFTEQDLKVLSALAFQAAISIENAMAFRRIEDQVKFQTQELESANLKIQQVSDLKSQFVSIASHDLRGPLSVIRESLAQVKEELAERLSERQKEMVDLGQRSVNRMLKLIGELLDLSRMESGKIELKIARTDLLELFRTALESVRSEAARKEIRITGPERQGLLEVPMDGSRIAQVLDNLLRNAIRHTPSGGTIEAGIKEELGAVVCSVRDTGVGIAPENLPRLFNQFTKFGEFGGLGLGLFISKKFVELHGGRIWVESAPGKGTVFFFSLPR